MTRRRISVAACAVALAGLLVGCSSKSNAFHRQFEAGDYRAAMETFRADSSLHDDEEALYRRGLLYTLLSSPYYDPGRAREAFQELLEQHPDTEHRIEANRLLGLLEEIQGLGYRVSELLTRLEQLKAVDLEEAPADDTDGRSSNAFHRQFEAGDYHAAMETFRADSSLHDDEEALYRRGLLYALPSSPYYDPGRAREAFGVLLERHPDTEHRVEADHLLSLLEEIQGLGSRVSELRTRLEQLKAVDLEEPPPDTGGVSLR